MFVAGSTTVRERTIFKGSTMRPSKQLARVGDPSAHRARRGRERAREQRAAARTLAALEIAIARAHGVFPARDRVAVHADAHRAARLAPVRARFDEDPMQ